MCDVGTPRYLFYMSVFTQFQDMDAVCGCTEVEKDALGRSSRLELRDGPLYVACIVGAHSLHESIRHQRVWV